MTGGITMHQTNNRVQLTLLSTMKEASVFEYATYKALATIQLDTIGRRTADKSVFIHDCDLVFKGPITPHEQQAIVNFMQKPKAHYDALLEWFTNEIGYVEQTARYNSDNTGKFTHVVFYNEDLFEKYEHHFDAFDFKSIRKHGTVTLHHITPVQNIANIVNNGFKPTDWVADLGIGAYCITAHNNHALHNVTMFFMSIAEDKPDDYLNTLRVLTFNYTGSYIQCINGYLHEGYIVIPNGYKPSDYTVDMGDTYLSCDNIRMDIYG